MSAAIKAPARKISVILADDHPVVRDGLAAIINQQPDMQVVADAGDGEEAIDAVRGASARRDGARSADAEDATASRWCSRCWRNIPRPAC